MLTRPSFFHDIDTPEKAYLLGVLFADGSINDKRHGDSQWVVQIGLIQEDRVSPDGNERSLLERLRDHLGSDGVIGDYDAPRKRTAHPRRIHKVSFCSNELAMDLQMHGMFPRKSEDKYGVAPALIPLEFVPDFARGLLDGDGGVELFSRRNKRTGWVNWERRPYWDNGLLVLRWLEQRLRELELIRTATSPVWQRSTWRLRLAGPDAIRVRDAMYLRAGDHCLQRKWVRFFEHPLDWQDYDGSRDRLPPRFQLKTPPPGRKRLYDHGEIRRLREEGASYEEIEEVVGCSRAVTLAACSALPKKRVSKRRST